jgi:SAM-dependent methyltransferase
LRVIAIEPGEAMRQAATAHPNVVWIAARAEATGIATRSIDLVLCAQSFHWFRPEEVLPEFARILGRRGRLAIVWNRRRASDAFTAGYRQVVVDVGASIAIEGMHFDPEVIPRSGLFSTSERKIFANPQRLDLDGLIGRARSASYAPKSGAAGEQLLTNLRKLHAQYADASGFVTLAQDTEIFLSTKV